MVVFREEGSILHSITETRTTFFQKDICSYIIIIPMQRLRVSYPNCTS